MAGVVHERSVKADGVDEPVTRDQLTEQDEYEIPAILKEVPQPMWWVDSDGVRTDIGGVVFLLNLFIRMNLFECFEEDFKLSQHISGWGLVELFGRTWLSIFGQVYEADNLWEVLERLDGREPGAAVAAGFENRDSYRIPPAWLLRFAPTEEPWQLLDCPGRLVLWHEGGGFPIVDCPLNGVARDEILTRQIAFYRNHGIAAQLQDGLFRPPDEATNPWPAALNRDVYFQRVSPPLMTWLSRTFPFVRYVLRYAFGAKSGDDKSLIENLFLKPGTIYCTATHFDLVMGLGEISLDVRRTCLDANPGWVPELMRVILFHFL